MHEKPTSYRNRLIILGLLMLGIFILYQMDIATYISADYLQANIDIVKEFIGRNYFLSALGYVLLLSVVIACSIPLGILLPIVGGFLFGWIPGALYSIASATIGGTSAFLASRYLIGEFFQKKFGARLEKFNHELDEYGYLYLLGLHFFPVTPFFVLNILSGLTRIPLFTFFWTTVVGVMPAFFIYSYIGNQLSSLAEFKTSISINILVAFVALKILSVTTLLVGRFGKKLLKKKK